MPVTHIEGVTQRIVVPNARQEVQVYGYGAQGPQGPPGPVGPPGSGGLLNDMADVNTGGVTQGDSLGYDLTSGLWIPMKMVRRAGDTMTGPLIINAPNVAGLGLTVKGPGGTAEGGQITLDGSTGTGVSVDNYDSGGRLLDSAGVALAWQAATVDIPRVLVVSAQSGDMSIRMNAASGRPYIQWNNAGGTRRGYLGYPDPTTNMSYLVAEGGELALQGAGGIRLFAGGNFKVTNDNSRMRFLSMGFTSLPIEIGELYGDAGIYSPNGLLRFSGSEFKWTDYGNTTRMRLNSNGLYLDWAGWLRVYGQTGLYWESYGGGITMTDSNYVKTYGSKILKSDTRVDSGRVAGSQWYEQGFLADAGSTMSGYAFHPGGTALSLKHDTGDTLHVHNSAGSGYCRVAASAFAIGSSLRYKQEIVPLIDTLPVMPANPVATMVRALRPRWWRPNEEQHMGELPLRPEGYEGRWEPSETTIHVCREEFCGHTPDDPCWWRANWKRGQLGFVAEEVEEVLPQLVKLNKQMEPHDLDLGSFIGLAYAMLQELDARLEELERKTDESNNDSPSSE